MPSTNPFLIFPAIDLQGGRCVRLRQGRAEDVTIYGDDPAAMARRWVAEGACYLHVVDLDGAFAGRPMQLDAVARICAAVAPVPVELGGGREPLHLQEPFHRLPGAAQDEPAVRLARHRDDAAVELRGGPSVEVELGADRSLAARQRRQVHEAEADGPLELVGRPLAQQDHGPMRVDALDRPDEPAPFEERQDMGLIGRVAAHRVLLAPPTARRKRPDRPGTSEAAPLSRHRRPRRCGGGRG